MSKCSSVGTVAIVRDSGLDVPENPGEMVIRCFVFYIYLLYTGIANVFFNSLKNMIQSKSIVA